MHCVASPPQNTSLNIFNTVALVGDAETTTDERLEYIMVRPQPPQPPPLPPPQPPPLPLSPP